MLLLLNKAGATGEYMASTTIKLPLGSRSTGNFGASIAPESAAQDNAASAAQNYIPKKGGVN
jgi:hypothetical protein